MPAPARSAIMEIFHAPKPMSAMDIEVKDTPRSMNVKVEDHPPECTKPMSSAAQDIKGKGKRIRKQKVISGKSGISAMHSTLKQKSKERRKMQTEIRSIQREPNHELDAALAALGLDDNAPGPSVLGANTPGSSVPFKPEGPKSVHIEGHYDIGGHFVKTPRRKRATLPERRLKSGRGSLGSNGPTSVETKRPGKLVTRAPSRVATAGIIKPKPADKGKGPTKLHPKAEKNQEARAVVKLMVKELSADGQHQKLREMRDELGFRPIDTSNWSAHQIISIMTAHYQKYCSALAKDRTKDDPYIRVAVASILSGLDSRAKKAKHREMRSYCGYIKEIDYTEWSDDMIESDMINLFPSWTWAQSCNNQTRIDAVKSLFEGLNITQKRHKVRKMRASCGLPDLDTSQWTEYHIETNMLKNCFRFMDNTGTQGQASEVLAENGAGDLTMGLSSNMAVKNDDAEMEL